MKKPESRALLSFFRLNLDVKVSRTTRDVNLPYPLSKPHSKKVRMIDCFKSETLSLSKAAS